MKVKAAKTWLKGSGKRVRKLIHYGHEVLRPRRRPVMTHLKPAAKISARALRHHGRKIVHSKATKKVHKTAKTLHYHTLRQPHLHLMRRFYLYRRYHQWRYHKHVHTGIVGVDLLIVLVMMFSVAQPALADVTQTWDFDPSSDFTFDSGLEVDGTTIRHKAQNYANDANTMGLWHLDEASGSTADDSSSNNNDGTISGGSFGTGNLNNGLSLDGINDTFSAADSSSLSLTGQHTLEGWVKPGVSISANSGIQSQSIFDKGDYKLYIDNETGKLTYELASNASSGWTQVTGEEQGGSWDMTSKNVASVTTVGSALYAGLAGAAGDADVWRWNGSTWIQIGGDGLNSGWSGLTYEAVHSLETDGTNIYAGLGSSLGDAEIWRWNGSVWNKIAGDSLNSSWNNSRINQARSLHWFNGKLYAGLGNAGNQNGEIWEWNGTTTWTQLGGNGIGTSWASTELVYDMASVGGKFYVGMANSPGDADVYEWTGGTTWTKVGGDGLTGSWAASTYESVTAMTTVGGVMYVGLGDAAGDAEVWAYSGAGTVWTKIGGDTADSWQTNYEQITSLGNDGTTLYASLGTGNADNEIYAYTGTGTAWTKIGGDGLNTTLTAGTGPDLGFLTENSTTLYWGTNDALWGGLMMSWNGSAWNTFGGQFLNKSWGFYGLGSVSVMHSAGSYMYAGTAGTSGNNAGTGLVWRFDGTTWEIIGGQGINSSWADHTYGTVLSMTGHNGKLYAGLGTTTGNAEVWEWNGTAWTKIGDGGVTSWPDATYEQIPSLISFNNKLYAGTGQGVGDGELYEWSGSGTAWTRVGGDGTNGSWTVDREIHSMTVFDGLMYIALGNTDNNADVWSWDGATTWTKIGGDGTNSSWGTNYNSVFTLTPHNNKLYAGLGASTGESEVWEWNGSIWVQVGGDSISNSWADGNTETVYTMNSYNGDLFVGLGNSQGDAEVWRFSGGSWSLVGGNVSNSWGSAAESVLSMSVYKGKLYAGLGTTTNVDATIWSYGNNSYLQSTASSWDTNWHHVAATYDGSTMRLYIDGAESGSVATAVAMPNTSRSLAIGTGIGPREQNKPQARFAGQLDELRISNIARSSFQATPYASTPQTVSPNDPVFENGIVSWSEFAESATTNGGSVNYRLSIDDGNSWIYWNGSAWDDSDDVSQATSAATIHANMMSLPVALGGGIKWQAVIQGNGNQRVTLNSVTVSGESDSVDPETNASNILMYRSNGGPSISSNSWTNGASPHFTWTAGADAGAGLYGYCLYLGQTQDSDPQTTKGLLGNSPLPTAGTDCQFIVPAAEIDLATPTLLGTALTTSSLPYYVYAKAIDNAGNVFNTSTSFQFRFDNTAPTNPDYITTPSQFLPTKEVDITWPDEDAESANDEHSGVAGLQYRIGNGGTWYGDDHNGTQNNTDLLVDDGLYTTIDPEDFDALTDGNNTIYFRTWDIAGNVSTTYVTGVIKINTSQFPGSVQNIQVTPTTNTLNSFAFEWDPPVEFLGPEASLTYCYTFNTEPTDQNCTTFTNPGVTSLPAGPYATQPGLNRIYIVAKDEAGNMEIDSVASATFTANTSAPGIPQNLDIADVSIRTTSKWRLALSWDEPSQVGAGVHHYQVYRSTDNNTFGLVDSPSGTSYINTDLASTHYYYKIRACDSANNCGAYSSVVDDTPTGRFTEAAELTSDPSISGISTRRATVSWTTDRESDSRISFGTSSGEYFPTELANSDQVTDHELALNNLSAGTTYYFVAKWTDEDGNTGVSAERTFSTAPAPTTKDIDTFNVNLSSATVRFSVKGATNAKVYYGKSEGFGGSVDQATSLSESSYSVQLTGLDDGTKYFYKVNTFDSDNNEYDGNIFSFTTPARPRISGLRFQPVDGEPTSTQKVTWTTNVPSSSTVIYGTEGQRTREVTDSELTTEHEVIIQGLIDDSEYRLTAQSRDGSGNLVTSDEQVFKTALDTRPPKVFDVVIDDSIRGTGSEARGQIIVSWKTDEPSTSQVAYGEGIGGEVYTTKTVEDTNLVTDHLVIVSDLPTSRTFHLIAISHDKSSNAGQSGDHTTIIGRASESVIGIIFNALQKVFAF